MSKHVEFSALIGETLTAIHGLTVGSDQVTFETESGRTFRMYHDQDCCESVDLNEIIGDSDHLLNSPILKADESSNGDNPPGQYTESHTWTFYNLATAKGYVTLRWLGQSNGYYSESVSFEEADCPDCLRETSLCPVCGMPKPEGLAHCSLACEEADGEDQPVSLPAEATEDEIATRLLADAESFMRDLCDPIDPAPVEGASDARD